MRLRDHAHGSWLGLIVLALAIAVLPVSLTACGGSSYVPPTTDPDPDPDPDPTPVARTVTATPPGGTYEPGTTQNVVLAVSGDNSAGASIFFSTDLSILVDSGTPTGNGTPYTAPIPITTDTVLKYYAVWSDSTNTAQVTEGYVFAAAGSQKAQMATSGHGHIANEAWRHWDEEDPIEVRNSCARCHTSLGYNEWAQGLPVTAHPPSDGLLDCITCHGDPVGAFPSIYFQLETYTGLIPVEFPSTVGVSAFESSNICMGCHQGRKSQLDVDAKLAGAAPWSFQNIHYYPAASTYWGSEVNGAYQYLPAEDYANRNTFPSHPDGLNTCVGCHMGGTAPHDHSFVPNVAGCIACHGGTTAETLGGTPGINHTKIKAAEAQLLALIEAKAATLPSGPIKYDAHQYPYWLNADTDAGYAWDDPALYKACYNYQVSLKEPCGYVHNGLYVRQFLHDSIVDMAGSPMDIPPGRAGHVPNPTNVFAAKTEEFSQAGHAHVTAGAFRHWDADYTSDYYDPLHADYDPNRAVNVPTSCAKCHSSYGYQDWVQDGTVDNAASVLTVAGCIACHNQANLFADSSTAWNATQAQLEPVMFPASRPGTPVTATLNGPSNVCMSCHQGRESGVSIDDEIAAGSAPYSFINIHYYAAAASFFGSGVNGGYEYSGNSYNGVRGWFGHSTNGFNTCVGCHLRGAAKDHSLVPQVSDCTTSGCHSGSSFETLNIGVGTNYTNIQTLLGELDAAIRAYAPANSLPWIGYDYVGHAYPYFFYDTNMNGVIDTVGSPPENIYPNAYASFDADLLRAAYNLQFGLTEPCGYIHNGAYMIQCLHDSITALGGTPSVSRP